MQTGDKVVYIMKSLPEIGLIKNRVYKIGSTAECGGCKDGLHIDVGISTDATFVYCGYCNNIVNIDDRYMFHHSGFRLLEDVEESILENVSELFF